VQVVELQKAGNVEKQLHEMLNWLVAVTPKLVNPLGTGPLKKLLFILRVVSAVSTVMLEGMAPVN
jgi:hypothetical protein